MTGKQLKNSILQWAIQGKLVPQNPNDESASALLERIRVEKARLIKEKKIKKPKNESIIFRGDDNSHYEKFADGTVRCIDDEIPFEIPSSWQWCRLINLASVYGGKRIPVGKKLTRTNTGFVYIRVADMKNTSVKTDDLHFVPLDVIESIKKYTISKDDLYITVAGTIGNVGKIPDELDGANLTENANKIVFSIINREWLLYTLQSPYLQGQISDVTTKVGQPKLAIIRIENLLLPLPPLEEQHKIVQRVESFIPHIARYTNLKSELDVINNTLCDLFKKSILQEAIQGKLVPQCSEDEPASALLQRIKAEKERLIQEKKIKRDKTESVIFRGDDNCYYEQIACGEAKNISEEIPFDIPESWQWCRLGTLTKLSIGKTPPRGDLLYWSNGVYPWISISDMTDYGTVTHTKERVSEYAVAKAFGSISPKGSLIMSFKLTVGRTSILGIDAYHNEAIITLAPFVDDDFAIRDYLFWVLPLISNYGDSKDAIKGKTLNSKSLYNLLIPLPPLVEQKRITEQIMILFEHLK